LKRTIIIILVVLPIILNSQEIIYQKWDEILVENVGSGYKSDIVYNSLDYKELEEDQNFKDILDLLEKFDLNVLSNRNEEIAFWVNIYNIAAVNMILKHELPNSIRDIGNLFKPVWKFDAINIGSKYYTLDHIEHKILRSYGEPLIHFAIVCASLSCPDMLNTVYIPETLIAQMEENTRNFLKNDSKGLKLDVIKNKIFISKIFKWFEVDFSLGIEQFIKKYSDQDISGYSVKYLDYNWQLNSP